MKAWEKIKDIYFQRRCQVTTRQAKERSRVLRQSKGLLALLIAFSTIHTPQGFTADVPIPSDKEEVERGIQMMHQYVQTSGLRILHSASSDQQRIRKIGERLVALTPRPKLADYGGWKFYIVEFNKPSATAFPGGLILIDNRFLQLFKGDDEIAFLLGHEMGHVLGYDYIHRDTSPPLRDLRENEIRADQWGVLLSCKAGYDVQKGIDWMREYERIQPSGVLSSLRSYFDEHPPLSERIQNATGYFETVRQQCSPSSSDPSDYVLLAKHGAQWKYNVTWQGQGLLGFLQGSEKKGTLTITNRGETVFSGRKATWLSWVYEGGDAYQMDLYLISSQAGILALGQTYTQGRSITRYRYEPPYPLLRNPVEVGPERVYQGREIEDGVRTKQFSSRERIIAKETITVPAGQFEAIKLTGEQSSGRSTEWWAKGVGLIRREEVTGSQKTIAELVQLPPPDAPLVARADTSQDSKSTQESRSSVSDTGELRSLSKNAYLFFLGTDQRTGTKFWRFSKDRSRRCWAYYGGPHIMGEVPSNVSLLDDELVRSILMAGEQASFRLCGASSSAFDIATTIFLVPVNPEIIVDQGGDATFKPTLVRGQVSRWRGAFTAPSDSAELQGYRNYVKEEDTKRRAQEALRAKQNEAQQVRTNFISKNRVSAWPSYDELAANPFLYQGKTIAVMLDFSTMVSATEAVFHIPMEAVSRYSFLVSNVPTDLFRRRITVVLAAQVIGKTKAPGGNALITHLKFSDAHFCKDPQCSDIAMKQ